MMAAAIQLGNPEIEEGPGTRPSKSSGVVFICPNNNNGDNSMGGEADGTCASCRESFVQDDGGRGFRITIHTQCSCSITAADPASGPPLLAPVSPSSSASVVVSVSSPCDDFDDDGSYSITSDSPSGPSLLGPVSSFSASVVSLSSVSEDGDGVLRYYTRAEIARHDSESSAWIVAGDDVYDVTCYVESHPGGRYSILKKAGGGVDCTRDLDFHSKRGQDVWKEYLIGKITDVPSQNGRPILEEKSWCSLSATSARPPSLVSVSSDYDDEDRDDDVLRYYSRDEIGRHDSEASAWIVAGNNVYDVTDYVESHPGGRYSIMKKAGGNVDCTQDVNFHSKRGQNLWKEYLIGKITDDPSKNGRPVVRVWWKFWEWA